MTKLEDVLNVTAGLWPVGCADAWICSLTLTTAWRKAGVHYRNPPHHENAAGPLTRINRRRFRKSASGRHEGNKRKKTKIHKGAEKVT